MLRSLRRREGPPALLMVTVSDSGRDGGRPRGGIELPSRDALEPRVAASEALQARNAEAGGDAWLNHSSPPCRAESQHNQRAPPKLLERAHPQKMPLGSPSKADGRRARHPGKYG